MRKVIVGLVVFLLALVIPMGSETVHSLPDAPQKRSSSAITITADGATLLVVNPDSNSLTLVDTASQSVIAEIPVGVDPRTVAVASPMGETGGLAYVANRGSDTVSVIDLSARSVITEVSVGNRPYGVVVSPDGGRIYVAEQGSDHLRILEADSLETVSALVVADRPSGLAIDEDGSTLYLTHLLTNTITLIHTDLHLIYLPLILKGAPTDPHSSFSTLYSPFSILNSQFSTLRLWPDSNLVQSIVIAPDGGSGPTQRAYIPHTQSNSGNRELTFQTTVRPQVSLIDLETQQHLVGEHIALDMVDPPAVGLPFDAAFTPDGGELWVVNAASNDVTVVDLETRQRAAHIEVGHNPRGIVIAPDGSAYVNNTLAGTVSVIDTAAYTITGVITTTEIPLPPTLLNGKRLFHTSDDPRLARDQWISCNTCHFEGEHDGRTWFFGFAGPRNTTGLLGMVETYPLRWSGEWDESADSEFANRKENFGSGLIEGEMNCSLSPPDCVDHPANQGRSYDLDCLAAFLDSLAVPLSPNHAHGEPLSGAEQRGQAIFNDPALGCLTCHPPPLYTDQKLHDVGTATVDEKIGPQYDTPTLRGLYDSAPYFHDGSAATLYQALTYPSPGGEHDLGGILTEDEIQDLIAFLRALPFE